MTTKITIRMTEREYQNYTNGKQKLQDLRKRMKQMNYFEDKALCNNANDITKGLTPEETKEIFKTLEEIFL